MQLLPPLVFSLQQSRCEAHDRQPAARTSSSVPGRASLSDDWTRDKIERKDISIKREGRSPSREISPVRAKRTLSRAPSVEAERSEKKAKPDEDAVAVEYCAGPAFMKAPHPSEVPLPTFPLFVKSPDPSELPIPKFLKRTKVAARTEAFETTMPMMII
ncbi:uncharacterized protein C2845_PM01G18090 [Panicum miliaceum]|uniref:Uncharacterized protein n=1 Tax=Panicum miliaceum TaxID=4540 RepID=A0A3L6TJD0_PANMI|nr:uncharacterized protein C2845_PM01G18090 [Panicum miliaceum]